jgi:DNA (cytosine-5)-methyltransferase 1
VFVVANARSWQRAAAVLFERESLCGNPPPRRSTGQATPCLSASGSGVSRTGFNSEEQWFIPEIAGCLNSASGHAVPGNSLQDVDQGYLVPTAFDAYNQTTNSDTYHTLTEKGNGARKDAVLVPISFPWQMGGTIQMPVDEGITGALIKNQTYAVAFAKVHTIAFAQNQRDEIRTMNVVGALAAESGMKQQTYVAQPVPYDFYQITAPVNRQNREPGDPCHTLARDNAAHATIVQPMQVRRLTPRECERLQGFPDDYTLIPYRNKPAADGPRYKALGNSMAVPVMAWIGKRIQMVSEIGQDNVS